MTRTSRLKFDNDDLHWDIKLAIPYTLIRGESATGKTFLIKNLKEHTLMLRLRNESIIQQLGFAEVIFLDVYSSPGAIIQLQHKADALVIIDDADFLRLIYPDLESWLTDGGLNTFIIFGRGAWNLSFLKGSVGELVFDQSTRTFTLKPEEYR